MEFEQITYEVADNIATITLNHPEKLNSFTEQMADEIQAAFDKTDADDDVRVVIVTGAGRAFCAGADLSMGASTFDYAQGATDGPVRADGSIDWSNEKVRDTGGLTSLRIYNSLKPVIGAINGPAVGIGVTMTLPMDIRMVAKGAKVGFVFARRGIVPEAASSWFLPRLVGISRAVEWCATGRVFSAEEGHKAGLFHSVHEPAELLAAARELAIEMAGSAPVSVALARKMMWQGLSMQVPMEAHIIDSRGVYFRGRCEDAKEGVTSFLEKREPEYTDRVSDGMPDWFPWWPEAQWR